MEDYIISTNAKVDVTEKSIGFKRLISDCFRSFILISLII